MTLHAAKTIPVRLNLGIAGLAILASLGALWVASHAANGWIIALAAFAFSFTNNTIFSLHHEAVHGSFHPERRINEAAGRLFAAFFPTIFSIQRISHFGHHARNRSDEELYDCYLPHQSWALKTYWIYCLLTGFYWAIIPFAGLLYVVCPWAFRTRWFIEGPARFWGFEPFVADIGRAPILPIWLEGVFSLSVQVLIVVLLDLNLFGWLACYWAFGLNWSSVQYTDHAGSPRDAIEGAWNLRFWPITQAFFLNYNLHLVHHRDPTIPWRDLPKNVRSDDPQPGFWPIYLRLWLGARPAPEGAWRPASQPKQPLTADPPSIAGE